MSDFLNRCLDFLKENWIWFVPMLLEIAFLFVLLLRKKVKVNDVLSMVLAKLPTFINSAEEMYTDGNDKLRYVLSCSISLLSVLNGSSTTDALDKYGEILVQAIEEILSTPQKKGD